MTDEDKKIVAGYMGWNPYPPMHIVLEPGEYKYTCPGCGHVTIFNVPGSTC